MKENDIPTDFTEFANETLKHSEEYFNMHLMCPFNNEKGECIVYDIRPIVCWGYRNYGKERDCEKKCNPKHVYAIKNLFIDNDLRTNSQAHLKERKILPVASIFIRKAIKQYQPSYS